MLHSFTIQNFRCFPHLTIQPLKQVNLIGGKNNVGKTSLLEALLIFLHPNNPQILLNLNVTRNLTKDAKFNDLEVLRGFFFNQDMEREIALKDKKTLSIRMGSSAQNSKFQLVMEYGNEYSLKKIITKKSSRKRQLSDNLGSQSFPLSFYLDSSSYSPRQDAELFSNMERWGRTDEIVATLRVLEPRLKRLSLLLVEDEPIIHGDIGMRELVPLPLMGEGIGRLLSIILAIANTKGSTVLIDEIENGFHHSVLTKVWEAIGDVACKGETQIFATTHSIECIRAAHYAFKSGKQYDFAYHRLDRVEDEIKAVTYDEEILEFSDEMNLEVR